MLGECTSVCVCVVGSFFVVGVVGAWQPDLRPPNQQHMDPDHQPPQTSITLSNPKQSTHCPSLYHCTSGCPLALIHKHITTAPVSKSHQQPSLAHDLCDNIHTAQYHNQPLDPRTTLHCTCTSARHPPSPSTSPRSLIDSFICFARHFGKKHGRCIYTPPAVID